jgi:tetratricopeptide (TPR) repeat protein
MPRWSLSSAALRDTRNADIENYLGYAYRKSGQVLSALTYYQRALQLDPRHRGAHEYIGEAYLMANNLTCEEYKDPQAGRRRLPSARCKVR